MEQLSRYLPYRNKGRNVELTKRNTVATRTKSHNYGIVFTSKPVVVGQVQMLKVTVTEKEGGWAGGMQIGFTGENPENSTLTQLTYLRWREDHKHLLNISGRTLYYKDKKHCKLDFNTDDFVEGDSLGMLLTLKKEVHWFVSGVWRGSVRVKDYPLDTPMWGVVSVYTLCKQVKAEICTVSRNPDSERRLREMGLAQDATPKAVGTQSLFARLGFRSTKSQNDVTKTVSTPLVEDIQLQLTRANELLIQSRSDIQELQREVAEKVQENTQLQQQLTLANEQWARSNEQLTYANNQRKISDTENQQLIGTLRGQVDVLQRRVVSLSATNHNSHPQEVEFWQVSPQEVSIREDEILGRGAWGYVAKGTFRGTTVAVKRMYPEILRQTTVDRIRREIRTMAQIRHPNLVLFVAAVLNEQTGPMIVTELLDTSLRSAYQDNRVGPNKRRIFGDISSALVYLHRQREPIIHRDVSSANVLLLSLPNNKWVAKLSDFGSANLARDATTPGEGAILYTAPEAFPQSPYSPQLPPQQTTKIDVYSFGVLACEVVTRTFPKSELFVRLLSSMEGVWRELHPLITSCVSHSPQDRPSMDTVLHHIKQLDSEP
ncbi:probable serine/threonine-protein kinase DDB_G0271682 [Halichondria panicea]|uniref:probable serine/threonine-protein kinase DDB_G0271682 n=1 Tax=Halichondria panicea TaxID=6063 RepID=UPI00312B78B7